MHATTADPAPGDGVLEVACDESGSEGEKLLGGTTDTFAHASVRMPADEAAQAIARLRTWTRSPADEYKASVVLRPQNRPALAWLLGPAGPLPGRARVHLVEKSRWVSERAVGLLLPAEEPGAATVLHREAPAVVGRSAWFALLTRFNDLVRSRDPVELAVTQARFARLAHDLADEAAGTPAGGLLRRLGRAADRPDGTPLARLLADPRRTVPLLDPLLPALAAAVRHWGTEDPVRVVHDQHHSLTPHRVALLPGLVAPAALHGVRLVDSRDDPRVQVADLLAGAARRLAADALHGEPDADLLALLRPHVDLGSVWGDPASGGVLLGWRQARPAGVRRAAQAACPASTASPRSGS